MLEFFVIFSKSGIVLFATVNQSINQVVSGLVKHVFLEERTGHYQTDQLQIKYHMDNEFELLFVVGYQKLLQISYVDKFLDDIQLAFRDKYSNFDLKRILAISFNKQASKIMKVLKQQENSANFHGTEVQKASKKQKRLEFCDLVIDDESSVLDFSSEFGSTYEDCVKNYNSMPKQEAMRTFQDSAKSKKTIASMVVKPQKEPPIPKKTKKPEKEKKKGKAARQWDLSGSNPDEFDFSKKPSGALEDKPVVTHVAVTQISPEEVEANLEMTESESSDDEDIENEDATVAGKMSKSSYFDSIWKSISHNRTLTQENLQPVLDQLRDHLTTKNVAAEIAEKLCESVGAKLEGQNVNTWLNLKKYARDALEEALLRILNPSKNINVLREIQAKTRPPYVMVFCGVNGVGKSTNLAKIAHWLMSNRVKVLVVACDTFRAGAIEQLKTHIMALKNIHERGKNAPIKIELFEKGYGRDSAAIAMEAINYARVNNFNCVMVDTAGRMQDNEPLMRELSKLIKINTPDLTLFVGEALVGNEAVDQLKKFNNSLIDCGCRSAINGIVLTKFDTIDDQVGAAISMTYVTGQPIVFVGVGQTYKDLKKLDAKAVTKALMH